MNPIPTREIFEGFPLWLEAFFYALSGVISAVFLYGFYRRFRKYQRGRPLNRFDHLGQRVALAAKTIAQNRTLFHRDFYAGVSHFLIFWGFTFLFLGTVTVGIDHDMLRFLGIKILQGTFYLWFSLVLDVWGGLFLAGLTLMLIRRFFHLPQLDYKRADPQGGKYDRAGFVSDDRVFLGLLLFIGVTGYLIEGFRIANGMPEFEHWSPVGWWVAEATNAIGLHSHVAGLHLGMWWIHAAAVMVLLAYFPYSKAMHVFTDTANLIFHDKMSARCLPPPVAPPSESGRFTAVDFTWKELLDLDACTKCGRCHVACPAQAAGTTLSPRDLILDLRTYVNTGFHTREWVQQEFGEGSQWPSNGGNDNLAESVIRPETLWSCTTCMACMEACPVGIEHLTHIVQMRRSLVGTGKLDKNLLGALVNLGEYGNSFGQSPKTRAKWTLKLPFKLKDARKQPVEYLWYVGDFASFDPRLQQITRTVAEVFQGAGVDFGILYDGEKNAGNDVRRVGEEGLFEALAEENVGTLGKAQFQEIVTTDPHTLNTLRNEYPKFGASYKVQHYTSLLAALIAQGKVQFNKKLPYKVTYHDPCYLARYNRETNAPREILKALGVELLEMPRCRENTFCCGAGGGRVWMDTSNEKERSSEQRIREALGVGDVRYFITVCPKDYVMYTDAVKTSGNEGKIEVKDMIELVAEAIS